MLKKYLEYFTSFNYATKNISENINQFIISITTNLDLSIINLISALAVLLFGLILAVIIAAGSQSILKRTEIDNRIVENFSQLENLKIEKWIPIGILSIIFSITIIAFLDILNLTQLTTPINALLININSYLPRIGAVVILLVIAWLLANFVKLAANRTINYLHLFEPLNRELENSRLENKLSLNRTISQALYWFTLLFFIPIILETLGLKNTLEPVQKLLEQLLLYLPKILSALLIGILGWFIAKTVRGVTTTFLNAFGADQLGSKIGMNTTDKSSLSWVGGTLIYLLILISTGITILNQLDIQAVSKPAITILTQLFKSLPQILTAGVILIIGFVTAKFVGVIINNILTGINFNNLTLWLGLPVQTSRQQNNSFVKTPSEIVGIVAIVGIMLFTIVTAIDILKITALTAIIQGITIIFSSVLAGLLVLGIGLYFANLAFNLIITSGISQARILAQTARITIIAFIGTMALQQIGIAIDIVNLAFGLSLSAISVSIGLAIGLGSREIGGKLVQQWLDSFKGIRS